METGKLDFALSTEKVWDAGSEDKYPRKLSTSPFAWQILLEKESRRTFLHKNQVKMSTTNIPKKKIYIPTSSKASKLRKFETTT